MPNNENDLSDNSNIKTAVDEMLKAADQMAAIKNGPIMRIVITGPVGIGKTILATRIERLLKEEFNADIVLVSAEIRQEQNAMNMNDWTDSMAAQMAKTVYAIEEHTVVQVTLKSPT